ncbi:serine/threonine protein kinase [Bosea caraganae]|uniref:Serine/threonine protein kinase n=1 Tax=Bosea caraganae TaxID=2763117 RepID=A0A370L830_9HYPH|nr:serine/threonine-protein kinase [Bosea caraganae]RDJ25086.1 serine/threonine protein kinase [Bosea caraganae]RDJ26196.1 serine/threonine protein kinase [Bosea caraganae]
MKSVRGKIPHRTVERALPVPLGTKVRGRFKIIDVIGRGGMSTVYRAIDLVRVRARAADTDVALKVIDVDEGYRPDAIALLHREGRRLLELQHPNIVRVYDSDEDGSLHFLVMELLRGKTLAKVMEERDGRPLEPALAMRVIRGVGEGLAAAHAQGMIHGDVKPGNVFITREGMVKLIDFGTAQGMARRDHELDPDEDATSHYVDRMRAVTPAYASLEMLAGELPDARDDVFSFAIIAHLILSGAHPFGGRTAEQALKEGLSAARPHKLAAARWVVLREALALMRDDRIATIAAFSGRLARPALADYWQALRPQMRRAAPAAKETAAEPEPPPPAS